MDKGHFTTLFTAYSSLLKYKKHPVQHYMKYREITSQKTIYKHKISCNSVSTFRKASNSSSQSYQSKSLIFTALYPLPVLMIPLHYNAARFSQENQSDWKYDGVSQKCCDRASNRSDLESFSHTKPLKHLKQLL